MRVLHTVERKRQPLDPPLSQDLSELCSEGGWVYSITSMITWEVHNLGAQTLGQPGCWSIGKLFASIMPDCEHDPILVRGKSRQIGNIVGERQELVSEEKLLIACHSLHGCSDPWGNCASVDGMTASSPTPATHFCIAASVPFR